jgi:hypothetical protein
MKSMERKGNLGSVYKNLSKQIDSLLAKRKYLQGIKD